MDVWSGTAEAAHDTARTMTAAARPTWKLGEPNPVCISGLKNAPPGAAEAVDEAVIWTTKFLSFQVIGRMNQPCVGR